jgi:hypothetical protein
MGRSGTTWVMDVINYRKNYRTVFEPFIASMVPEAFCFNIHHYIRPGTPDPLLEKQARLILSGKTRNPWVDSGYNRKVLYRKRIIKDIRCNLMLGWLKSLLPDMPVILLVRHPLAIAHSWESLSMLAEDPMANDRRDFELIISQKALLDDFPVVRQAAKEIDRTSILETIVFIWCVLYYVPLSQLGAGDAYKITYEELMIDPESAFAGLFGYLGDRFNWDEIKPLLRIPSITNFLKRKFLENDEVLFGWKKRYSDEELRRADSILIHFGLDHVYGPDGLPSKDLKAISLN